MTALTMALHVMQETSGSGEGACYYRECMVWVNSKLLFSLPCATLKVAIASVTRMFLALGEKLYDL